jgi:hypothetical protein
VNGLARPRSAGWPWPERMLKKATLKDAGACGCAPLLEDAVTAAAAPSTVMAPTIMSSRGRMEELLRA